MLRKGGSEEAVYKTGDFVAFMRRRGGGPKWFGPARVLVQEGKNIWVLHGGVPTITSVHMVRPATAEQFLEEELLGKTHQLHGQGGQLGYLDIRQKETNDAGESMAEIMGLTESRAGTTVAGGDPESPKRMRSLIEEAEKTEKDAEEIPVPEGFEDLEIEAQTYSPSIAPMDETPAQLPSTSTPIALDSTPNPPASIPQARQSPPQETDLQRAMRASGGNQLDVGLTRSRVMQNEPTERSYEEKKGRTREDRSRSPAEERNKEFVAFMAKRSNNKPAGIKTPGEMESKEMQLKLDQARGREWTNWVKYKAIHECHR